MQGCFMQFLRLIFVKKLQLQGSSPPGPHQGRCPLDPHWGLLRPPGPHLSADFSILNSHAWYYFLYWFFYLYVISHVHQDRRPAGCCPAVCLVLIAMLFFTMLSLGTCPWEGCATKNSAGTAAADVSTAQPARWDAALDRPCGPQHHLWLNGWSAWTVGYWTREGGEGWGGGMYGTCWDTERDCAGGWGRRWGIYIDKVL